MIAYNASKSRSDFLAGGASVAPLQQAICLFPSDDSRE
jgi:hypothetical protein